MVAPTPVIRTLIDSYEDIIVEVTIPLGGDADITATTIVDISAFTTGRTSTEAVIIDVHASLIGLSIMLWEDASADVHLLSVSNDHGEAYPAIGMTGAAGTTGDVKFTTVGVSATSHGSFILHMKKI